jgi:hypothetical protein
MASKAGKWLRKKNTLSLRMQNVLSVDVLNAARTKRHSLQPKGY